MPNGEPGIAPRPKYDPGAGTLVPFGHGIIPGTPGGTTQEVLYTVPSGKVAFIRSITAGLVADLSGSALVVTLGSSSLGKALLIVYNSTPATGALPSYATGNQSPQIAMPAGQTIEDFTRGGVTIYEYWAEGFVEEFNA